RSPAAAPGFFYDAPHTRDVVSLVRRPEKRSMRPLLQLFVYLATYRLARVVAIWLNVVTISFEDVNRKNLSGSGYFFGVVPVPAQFCNSVEVGSPSVLTCTV